MAYLDDVPRLLLGRPGEYEYVVDGTGLERKLSIAEANVPDQDFRLRVNTEAAFTNDLVSYKRIGEALLRRDVDGLRTIRAAMFADDRSRDLGHVVAMFRALSGPRGKTNREREMAGYYRKSWSTLRRRLDDAQARGLIAASERETRPRRRAA